MITSTDTEGCCEVHFHHVGLDLVCSWHAWLHRTSSDRLQSHLTALNQQQQLALNASSSCKATRMSLAQGMPFVSIQASTAAGPQPDSKPCMAAALHSPTIHKVVASNNYAGVQGPERPRRCIWRAGPITLLASASSQSPSTRLTCHS